MVYFVASNNQNLTFNNNIGYLLSHGIHRYSFSTQGKHLYDQVVSQLSIRLLKIKAYIDSKYASRLFGVDINNELTDSKNIDLNWLPHKFLSNPSFQIRRSIINSIIQPNNLGYTTLKNTTIPSSYKHQHLFNQIRTFKSEKTNTGISLKDKGLCSKMKAFFGFNDIPINNMSNTKRDLENFQIALNKENLSPEHSQKIMLAFMEGYLLAKESFIQPRPTRRFFFLSVALGITGLVYIFLKQSNISSLFKHSNTTIEVSESNVKFNDVKGVEEAKQELKNIVEFLKTPEKFSALGGKLPKGVLLVGPPGTGKTLLAKAVAGEAGVPFFSTSGSEFDEIFVGVGARRIRELFKLAKENIPCVIFIDEIDSIGKERTSSSLHPHANDSVNQLLSEMDGFRNSEGIIVLGATNRREDLDKALLRPGRFDVEVTVAVPDYSGRKELLEFYLSHVRHQSIDVERLARGTTNFTGADIENMVNQAALRAAVIGAQYVTMEHLEYARDKALMGPESMSRIPDEETNKITAYHEGGHTVVAYYTKNAQPLHKVTIIARGSSLGHTAYIPDKDIYHVKKSQLLAMLDSMMGGRAAEELIFGSEKITSGASSDLEQATELASKMVKRWGMSDSIGLSTYNNQSIISPQAANLIDTEIKKILQESYDRAKNILIIHKDKHTALSEALLKYETLDAEEISAIMEGHKDFIKNNKNSKLG